MRTLMCLLTVLTFLIGPAAPAMAGDVAAGVGDASSGRVFAPPSGASGDPVVNFDGGPAPCAFVETTALKSLDGVTFKGKGDVRNGGAVLDQCSNFGVTGHSPPNFLAFNCGAVMSDGGIPTLPETIILPSESTGVSLKVGDGSDPGKIVKIVGIGSLGKEKHTVTTASALQTVTFANPVSKIKIKAPKNNGACHLVVDDLTYNTP